MKNTLKSLVVVGLVSAAGIAQARFPIVSDALNTAGNVVKGGVNTAVALPRSVVQGEGVVEGVRDTVTSGVNTAAGAVSDTGKTVTNIFNDGANPVENEDLEYTSNAPLLGNNGAETSSYSEEIYEEVE